MEKCLSVQQQVVRDCEKEDFAQLERIHETTGFDYRFPNLSDPLFCVKKVVEEDGVVTQGIALKLEATVYLWIDPVGTRQHRLLKLKQLVDEIKREAWSKGLDTLTCVIPPELGEEFSEVLQFLGMTKDRPWPKWSLDLTEGY